MKIKNFMSKDEIEKFIKRKDITIKFVFYSIAYVVVYKEKLIPKIYKNIKLFILKLIIQVKEK